MGGVPLAEIAARYGTPAYVLDEDDVRTRCRQYREAFGDAEVAYAGQAFLCRAMTRWVDEEGLSLVVCSEGELAVAGLAGFPAERILLHGNAKTPGDLRAALACGVGRIVVDSPGEIARIAAFIPALGRRGSGAGPGHTRCRPARPPGGDRGRRGPEIRVPARFRRRRRRRAPHPGPARARASWLHYHLGSQTTGQAVEIVARRLADLMAVIRAEHGVILPELNLGGGHGVRYSEDDQDVDLAASAARIRAAVRSACASMRLPVPRLTIEPGRAIVSRAAVTLYRVVSLKYLDAGRAVVAVDGGMSDNPRPALYGARYLVRAVSRPMVTGQLATVVGRHGEASDVLATDAVLPADTGRATCSPWRAPGPTTMPWRRTTTWSGARRWSPSGTGARACSCAGRPSATCASATWACDHPRGGATPARNVPIARI